MDEELVRHTPQVMDHSNEILPLEREAMTRSLEKVYQDYERAIGIPRPGVVKNKYDINYSIALLQTILREVEAFKFSQSRAADMSLSLSHSIKKMLNMLEVERDNASLK